MDSWTWYFLGKWFFNFIATALVGCFGNKLGELFVLINNQK